MNPETGRRIANPIQLLMGISKGPKIWPSCRVTGTPPNPPLLGNGRNRMVQVQSSLLRCLSNGDIVQFRPQRSCPRVSSTCPRNKVVRKVAHGLYREPPMMMQKPSVIQRWWGIIEEEYFPFPWPAVSH